MLYTWVGDQNDINDKTTESLNSENPGHRAVEAIYHSLSSL